MSKVGRKIVEALRELEDVMDSGEPLESRFTVRTYVLPAEPAAYDGAAIRAVRERFRMSQGIFARFLCVSPATVQSWEQGRRVPSPLARRFLGELIAGEEYFKGRFAELAESKTGSRPAGHRMKATGEARAVKAAKTR